MHMIPGLRFQENHLCYLENRYGIQIDRVPHWAMSQAYSSGAFRWLSRGSCPVLSYQEVKDAQRERTGIAWIVAGEKRSDSLFRAKVIAQHGGIRMETRDAFPIAYWTDRQVLLYCRTRNIVLPADYRMVGRSISCQLTDEALVAIREHFPDDYAKILEVFPLAEAATLRNDLGRTPGAGKRQRFRSNQTPKAELRRPGDLPEPDQSGTVQPPND